MDRLISEQAVIDRLTHWYSDMLETSEEKEDLVDVIKAIPSADLDLKQSFKDGYDTALNDVEDRIEALLNNNPWYANAISDILQIISEQRGE